MDIDSLLTFYKGGRRPPLDELVNGELLKIFQRGVVKERVSSFGLLLPAGSRPDGGKERWLEGEFINADVRWQPHCAELRHWQDPVCRPAFDERCNACDREHAYEAEKRREPIIYLCHGGMVDYALPIVVDGQTVAVLFAGQQRPAEGNIWSDDVVAGCATASTVAGQTDARAESERRNRTIMEQMMALTTDREVADLVGLAMASPEVTPEEVPGILQTMQEASAQLSQLAERTIGYQLNVIKAYFTSQAARLLPVTDATFWSGISKVLSGFAEFCESDYVFLSMLKRPTDDFMTVATSVPGSIPAVRMLRIRKAHFFPLKDRQPCEPTLLKPAEAKRQLFDNAYLFDSPCYVLALEVHGPLGVVVIGNCKRKGFRRLGSMELQFIQEQFGEISIILESRRQLQARDELLTDLSHEVKSPLAAVLAVAENLAASRIEYVNVQSTASRMLARLRRLQMSVDRFRMLEKLLSNPDSLARGKVSVYEVAKECEREYGELARERDMNLQVARELANLPSLLTDREAFKHALGNLIDNAIKYGNGGTDVLIEGRVAGTETKIDVRDIGIPLEAEDRKFLGLRGFRTNAARKRDPSGTGIGFTIIDRFLKLMGGRFEVQSLPYGSSSFHVVISLFLPR